MHNLLMHKWITPVTDTAWFISASGVLACDAIRYCIKYAKKTDRYFILPHVAIENQRKRETIQAVAEIANRIFCMVLVSLN